MSLSLVPRAGLERKSPTSTWWPWGHAEIVTDSHPYDNVTGKLEKVDDDKKQHFFWEVKGNLWKTKKEIKL